MDADPATIRRLTFAERAQFLREQSLADAKREWDNVGVYPVTLVRWLTGRPFRSVLGVTANYFFAEHQKRDVEDFGVLSGTLEGGLPVTIKSKQ